MTISPEVQTAVDEIRKDRDLIASMRKADDLRDQQLADLRAQVAAHPSLSDEDKKALTDAVSDAQDLNHSLEGPVVANTQPAPPIPAAPPAAPSIPLMPTSAFDPNPHSTDLAEGSGQPPQAKAIETAGGFIVSGGGTAQRAPEPAPEALPAAAAEPVASEPAISADTPAATPEPSPGQLPFTTPVAQDAAALASAPGDPNAPPMPPPNPDPVSAPTPGPATFTPPPPSNPPV